MSHNNINLVGQRFGRLVVVQHAGYKGKGKSVVSWYLCVCDWETRSSSMKGLK